MKCSARVKLIAVGVALTAFLASSAWAFTFNGDNYSDGDLNIIKAVKSANPGVLSSINLDNPTVENFVVLDDMAGDFPPSVKTGDTLKAWIQPGKTLDDDYSGDMLGWVNAGGEWRVEYISVAVASPDSFNGLSLASLPYLGNIVFHEENKLTEINVPKEFNGLYSLDIHCNSVTNADVSSLTNLVYFKLVNTGVTSITLPPSTNLKYLRIGNNKVLKELSGFYEKETALSLTDDRSKINNNPELKQHTITIQPSANGTITPNGGDKIYNGDTVTFTVKPASGYKLNTFTINGSPVTPSGGTYAHKATGNVTAAATFAEGSDNNNDGQFNYKSGGGCGAGYGALSLLLAGLAMLKSRKA